MLYLLLSFVCVCLCVCVEIEAGEAKCSLLVKSYDSLLSNSSSASGSLALPIPCAELTQKVSDLRELYEAQTANEAKLAEVGHHVCESPLCWAVAACLVFSLCTL